MLTPPEAMSCAAETPPSGERRCGAFPPENGVQNYRRYADADALLQTLQRDGVLRADDGPSDASRAAAAARASLFEVLACNEGLVHTIQEAVQTTLKVHSRSAIHVMPVRSEGLPGKADVAIIGVLRLTGSPSNSMLALGLSRSAFAAIYENMFGEPMGELSDENQDLAGELVNIIFQSIDPELRALGIELEPSLPVFLTGRAIEGWAEASVGRSFVLPFSTEAGDLFIAIPDASVAAKGDAAFVVNSTGARS